MTKEKFFEWLDSRIKANKGGVLLDDDGNEFAIDCAAYRDKIHVFGLYGICDKFGISAKITSEDFEDYPASISFQYHGYTIYDLMEKEELKDAGM